MESIAPLEGMAVKPTSNGSMDTSRKQSVLRPWLVAQALNLVRHTEALRPFRREEFGTGAEAPTDGHILAVNQLMASLRRTLRARASLMNRYVRAALRQPSPARLRRVVTHKHNAHSWVQAIERIWDWRSHQNRTEQKSVSLAKRAEASYAEYRRQKASGSGGCGFRLP